MQTPAPVVAAAIEMLNEAADATAQSPGREWPEG